MGYFQAFDIKTETDQAFSTAGVTPTPANYYTAILTAALPATFFAASAFTPSPPQWNKTTNEFEVAMSAGWGDNHGVTPMGYILQDTHLSKDLTTLLDRIADEENKYYWKWLEGSNEVQDTDGSPVLNELRIVNARLFDKIFFPIVKFDKDGNLKIEPTADGDKWTKQEKPLQDDTLIAPAIAISDAGSYVLTDGNGAKQNYYGVYVNPKARLLFLDNGEETSRYKYAKNSEDNKYEKQRTYIYYQKYSENSYDKTAKLYGDYYFKSDGGKDLRYLIALAKIIRQWHENDENNNVKGVGTGKDDNIMKCKVREKILLDNIRFKTADTPPADDTKKNAAKSKDAQDLAEDAACQLPWSTLKCNCFYYANGITLMGHVSSVLIGEGGRGGSGYPMRADKVDEVNYCWEIALSANDENMALAKLWSYLFDLDPSLLTDSAQGTPQGFYPTNWPYDKTVRANTAASIASWIRYYKTFKNPQDPKRRNRPDSGPFPPRLTNPDISAYPYKFTKNNMANSVKLDNSAYRVWKKYNTSGGGLNDLTLGSESADREQAGPTMAAALGNFSIYPDMQKAGRILNQKGGPPTPPITASSLSATSFAAYLLKNDDLVQGQWRADNFLDTNTPVTASSLRTNQEWCHLFGHGDGGPEELGNFVSGSKHCNTEQLAIEVGQRRVSHNETDFTDTERDKIKARITAYLIPNAGTWVSGGTYTADALNKTLFAGTGATMTTAKAEADNFFEQVPSTNPVQYRLKLKTDGSNMIDDAALKTAFQNLSDRIRDPNNSQTKKQLFQLRRNIEKHFFMYLPLARWMRYKLYYRGKKIFDHIYDAQSESINLHECQILDYTVERVLYKAIDASQDASVPADKRKWNIYKQKMLDRVEKLVPTAEEAAIIKDVLDVNLELFNTYKNLKRLEEDSDSIKREISQIQTVLSNNSPQDQFLAQLSQNAKNLQQLITDAGEKFKLQKNIYDGRIQPAYTKLPSQAQAQSVLNGIVTSGGQTGSLEDKINELCNIGTDLFNDSNAIIQAIQSLTNQVSQNNLDAVQAAVTSMDGTRKRLRPDDSGLSPDETQALRRRHSMTENAQRVANKRPRDDNADSEDQ